MNAVPPKLAQSNSSLRPVVIILGSAVVILGTLVFFFNPTTHHFYPVCQFHRLTGLNCPGCGMTRALYALLHGDFASAVRDNALLMLALAAIVIRSAWFGWNKLHQKPNGTFFPAKLLWPLLILAIIFTGLRNLPVFSYLSP